MATSKAQKNISEKLLAKEQEIKGIDQELEKTPMIKSKLTKEQMRQRDAELVEGKFTFNEVPGGTLKFSYKKYKNDPVKSYTLVDGNIYKIPRGVAKHLVETGSYRQHEYAKDADGKDIVIKGRKITRYSFEPLGFFDDDIADSSSLYEVKRI